MESMVIEKNTIVSLRFIMRNEAGEVMEDNTGAPPVHYLHGSGHLMPALESAMVGLRPGDTKQFSVRDELLRGEFSFQVFVDSLRMASPAEIASGQPETTRPGDEVVCGPGCIC